MKEWIASENDDKKESVQEDVTRKFRSLIYNLPAILPETWRFFKRFRFTEMFLPGHQVPRNAIDIARFIPRRQFINRNNNVTAAPNNRQ